MGNSTGTGHVWGISACGGCGGEVCAVGWFMVELWSVYFKYCQLNWALVSVTD